MILLFPSWKAKRRTQTGTFTGSCGSTFAELLGQEVKFAADANVVGVHAKAAVAAMKDGDVILLENTRYRVEETKMERISVKTLRAFAMFL